MTTKLPRDERRWNMLWQSLDGQPPPHLLDEVLEAYSDPCRHYHALSHLRQSLRRFDAVARTARRPALVEAALWFHDTVYQPARNDNEEQSARWARDALARGQVDPGTAESVATLIRATDHQNPAPTGDQGLLCDIDLAILGASPRRYQEYEAAIRAEYSWVPIGDYRKARAKLLRGFLAREHIYATARFRRSYEKRARRNLKLAIASLAEPM